MTENKISQLLEGLETLKIHSVSRYDHHNEYLINKYLRKPNMSLILGFFDDCQL